MRRSSKASQLLSQSGHDDIYKFRCMQYLNFVLDQVVNEDNKFKLYPSHIESLLRSNLNDISIQDIEKIKRMLDEGEKQKIDTQQTGDFINYDLLQKQKYSLQQTHHHLEQGPTGALILLQGHNPYTMNEVQLLKQQHRRENLHERNFRMLESMHKLPEEFKKIEEELEKGYEKEKKGMAENQAEIGNQGQLENVTARADQEESLGKDGDAGQKPYSPTEKPIPSEALQAIKQPEQLPNTKKDRKSQQKQSNLLTPQKPKQLSIEPQQQPGDLSFVQIKKKTKRKKPPVSSPLQKPVNVVSDQHQQKQAIHEVLNGNVVEGGVIAVGEGQKDAGDGGAEGEEKANPDVPQKRKYIRKKPFEPKKKVEKEKQSESAMKKAQSEELRNLQVQSSNQQPNQSLDQVLVPFAAVELQPKALQQEKPLPEQPHPQQSTLPATTTSTPAPKTPVKPRKPKKVSAQKESQQQPKSQTKKSTKKANKSLQIVLPYPDCQMQCDRLKQEVENLHKKIEAEKAGFQENIQHALTILSMSKAKEQSESKGAVSVGEVQGKNEEKQKDIQKENQQLQGEKRQLQAIQLQITIPKDEQNPNFELNNNQQGTTITTPTEQQQKKPIKPTQPQLQPLSAQPHPNPKRFTPNPTLKPPTTTIPTVLKKQPKKESSQQYKPQQDQLQSIQEFQANDGFQQADYYQPGKHKKKTSKKKIRKEMSSKEEREKSKERSVDLVMGSNYNSIEERAQEGIEGSAARAQEGVGENDVEGREKKVKLTPEQREKVRLHKERLKAIRMEEKEKKKMLKELEKQQKQTSKGKKIQKPQKPNPKPSTKPTPLPTGHQNTSNPNESSSHNNTSSIIAGTDQKSQHFYAKQIQIFQHSQQMESRTMKQKKPLDESMGNNSTKEDINVKNSFSLEKPMGLVVGEDDGEGDDEEELEFVAIQPAKMHPQHHPSPTKRDCPSSPLTPQQHQQFNQHPRKKQHISSKSSQLLQDPQYGISPKQQNGQVYRIQVFGSGEGARGEEGNRREMEEVMEKGEEVREREVDEGEGEGSEDSSLSAGDD